MTTELHEAAKKGDVNKIRELIKGDFFNKSIPVDKTDLNGSTALHWAALNGQVAAMRCLVQEFKANAHYVSQQGQTPLFQAIIGRKLDAIKFLVNECKVNVNSICFTFLNRTALHCASQYGYTEGIRCLMDELKADPTLKDKEDNTPWDLAPSEDIRKELPRIMTEKQMQEKNEIFIEKMFKMAPQGDVYNVRRAIQEGQLPLSIINETNSLYQGYTVLQWAIWGGGERGRGFRGPIVDVIRCLVNEFKADVNGVNNNGETALHVAAKVGNAEEIQCLINEFKADATIKNNEGKTPYDVAKSDNIKKTLLALVPSNNNPNIIVELNNKGALIKDLFAAVQAENIEQIREVMKSGIPIDSRSEDGKKTALHAAALTGNMEVMRCLIKEFGADVNAVMDYHGSALHILANQGNGEAIKFLVRECNADIYNTGGNLKKFFSHTTSYEHIKVLFSELEAGHREKLNKARRAAYLTEQAAKANSEISATKDNTTTVSVSTVFQNKTDDNNNIANNRVYQANTTQQQPNAATASNPSLAYNPVSMVANIGDTSPNAYRQQTPATSNNNLSEQQPLLSNKKQGEQTNSNVSEESSCCLII